MRTMPVDGEFVFKCEHCGHTRNKTPKQLKDDGQDYKLYFCDQCKQSTLIQYRGNSCAIFKVVE